MQSLDKRVATLEKKTAIKEKITIIRRIVWVGQQGAEIEQLRDEQENSWSREQSESEQDFIERVKSEAFRNEWGVMVLNGFVWNKTST
jgi:hypothetical protein